MLGQTISHYEIVGKLGEGGMGVVYRARDRRLNRFVAIKFLPQNQDAGRQRKQRFLQEARAASALDHPGIVTIHHIDSHDGVDYIVMELIEGRPLAEWIPTDGMPFEQVIEVGAQIAEAMAAAHDAGIVHRDLKPQNVILANDDRVKVLDFGVAKLNPIAAGDSDPTTITAPMTEAGLAIGTVSYMSPEQALGEEVDQRSDVFSLGSVLYHMLTGEPPFQGPHIAALLHELHYGEPQPVHATRPGIPTALESVVARALEKHPGRRYQDMRDLAIDLRSVGAASRTTTEETATVSRAPPSRRHWWIPVGTCVGLLLSAVVVSEILKPARQPESPVLDLATPPDENDAYALYHQGRQQLERYDQPRRLQAALDTLEQAVALDPDFAAAHAALARALWARYHAENKDRLWLDRAMNHATRALELSPHLALAHTSLALVQIDLGALDDAFDLLERARALDPTDFQIRVAEGIAYQTAGDLARAETALRRAVELGPDSREPHDYLGSVLLQQGQYQQAEASFVRSTELAPDCYISQRNLAAAYQLQGRYDEAASALQRSLEIRPTWSGYSNLGTLHFTLSRYRDAVRAFESAIELGANDYRVWGNLADAYRWTPENRDRAVIAYQRAIQLAREKMGAESEDPTLRSRLAVFLAKRGDCQEALDLIGAVESLPSRDANLLARAVQIYEICDLRDQALLALEAAFRAGFPEAEIRRDPELIELRRDVGYHLLVTQTLAD